jgi:hypothetical protein
MQVTTAAAQKIPKLPVAQPQDGIDALSKPVHDIVREYFPTAKDDELDFILWDKTGWPAFWNGDPETCLREQLAKLAKATKLKREICYGCGKMRSPSQMGDFLCKMCDARGGPLTVPKWATQGVSSIATPGTMHTAPAIQQPPPQRRSLFQVPAGNPRYQSSVVMDPLHLQTMSRNIQDFYLANLRDSAMAAMNNYFSQTLTDAWKTGSTKDYFMLGVDTGTTTSTTGLNQWKIDTSLQWVQTTTNQINVSQNTWRVVDDGYVDSAPVRRPPPLDFNKFLNASDMMEEFIRFCGTVGVRQSELMDLPVGHFINWLILKAAEADGEEPPKDIHLQLPSGPKARHSHRCKFCGRFIPHPDHQMIRYCNEHCQRFFENKQNRAAFGVPLHGDLVAA